MPPPEGSPRAALRLVRPTLQSPTIELHLAGRVSRSDAARVGRNVRRALDDRPAAWIVCDVGALGSPDAAVIDILCRIRLIAGRRGCRVRLRGASPELAELLFAFGFADLFHEPEPDRAASPDER